MNPILKDAYSIQQFRSSAHRVVDLLADHLESSLSGEQPQALPWLEPEKSLEHWQRLLEKGLDTEEFCREVIARSVHISDPKFMGHQICAPAPTAILAGLLTDALNNGSGVYEMGMAGTAMEKLVLRTVARQLGMPETADGIMTSGGTLANLTAMLAARAVGGDGQDWTRGTQCKLAVLVSDQAHYCIDRAVRIMGWGDDGIIRVPTDEQFCMRVSLLPRLYEEALNRGVKVVAVVGSACSTSTGSFDDLRAIGEFCQRHALWFHVDGAHGAAVAFSKKHRDRIAGVETADSIVLDFHKMMMTPVVSSGLLFRRREDSFRPFCVEADYLFSKEAERNGWDEFNLARRTFECTKTMLSSKVFSLLAVHGPSLFEANVDRLHDLAQTFAKMLDEHDQFELATWPQTNILCFRWTGLPQERARLSERNEHIRESLVREGRYYIVKTSLRGETWLRTTIANPFTTETEMAGLLERILALAEPRQVQPGGSSTSAS